MRTEEEVLVDLHLLDAFAPGPPVETFFTRLYRPPPQVPKINRWTLRRIKAVLRPIVSQWVVSLVLERLRDKMCPRLNPSSVEYFLSEARQRRLDRGDVGFFLWATTSDFDGLHDAPHYCEHWDEDYGPEDHCGNACYPDPECSSCGHLGGVIVACGEFGEERDFELCDCLFCSRHGNKVWELYSED